MSPSSKPIFRFGDVEVDVSRGCVRRDGQELHLRQQTFQVMIYLLENRERVITKEELLQNIWKETAVTDDALVQCVMDIRRAIGDDSRRPHFIKTLPKVGYRFIGTVEERRGETETGTESEEQKLKDVEIDESGDQHLLKLDVRRAVLSEEARRTTYRHAPLIGVGVVIIAAVIFLVAYIRNRQVENQARMADVSLQQLPGRKTVAVMYFDNQSESDDLDWLREGLADMIITNLSRSDKLSLLSRQQLHLLLERIGHRENEKIRLNEATEVARRSQARIVVLGSFARLGDQIRIDVHLHDVHDGQLLAAERLIVAQPAEILTQIDVLSLKLASHLGALPAEARKLSLADVMTDNLEAYRYYSLAIAKAQALNNREAIALLQKAVKLDPQFAMAHGRIGFAYAVTDHYAEEAKPHLEKAFQLANHLTEKDSLYIKAWYSIANLDFTGAVEAFRKIIAQYPMEVEAYLTLGYLLRGEGQHDEAINVLKQSLVIDQEARDVYNALGLTYLDLHRYDEAIAAHQRYVQLAPSEPNAYDSLGMSYQCAGRYAEALNTYGQALALRPDHFIANIHLGNTYVQLGRYKSGLDQYRRLVQTAPDDFGRSRAYASIAETYLRMKDVRQAASAVRMELKFEKYNAWNSVVVALEQGDRGTVEKLRGRLSDEWPFTHRGQRFPARLIHYRRGYLALKSGSSEEAIQHFKEALRHPPAIWMIDSLEDCLGKAYLDLGRWDEAIAEYRRILRLNQNYPLAHYHLAQAYERKGQPELAQIEYERFLQVWKDADADGPQVIAAKKALESSGL